MNQILDEIRIDLLKIRRLIPVNTHESKGIFRKLDRALAAIARRKNVDVKHPEVFQT